MTEEVKPVEVLEPKAPKKRGRKPGQTAAKKKKTVKAAVLEDGTKLSAKHWNQTRRLEFIDFRLAIDGHFNRQDLVEFFGISVPQASLDMAKYLSVLSEKNPPRQNLYYDRHQKVYVRSEDFEPLFPNICTTENYLNDLLLAARGELQDSRNIFGFVPSVGIACFTPPRRNVSFTILRNLVEAIQTHKAVHITYMSIQSEAQQDHLVAPHGFGFDGLRWHVRAYCYDRHAFLDYVLSRIVDCAQPKINAPNDCFPDPLGNGFREVGTTGRDDKDWNEMVELKLKANPELSEPVRRAIELDYGMEKNGCISYLCRKALLFYALQYLRLSRGHKVLAPQERHLALENEDEVYAKLEKK